jgi:hypothetical protein
MTNAQKLAQIRQTARIKQVLNSHPETKLSLIFGEILSISNKKRITPRMKIALSYHAAAGLIEVSRLCKLIRRA